MIMKKPNTHHVYCCYLQLSFGFPQLISFSCSALRILLLGKKVSENSRVGNLILNTDVFENENPSSNTKHQCRLEGGGELRKSYVAVINNSQLLQRLLSDDEITEAIKECINLSSPGPHVFILVLQHNEFSEEDMRRVKYVLRQFSKEAMERTIMVMTDEEIHSTVATPANLNVFIKQLTEKCGGRCLHIKDKKKIRSKIFKNIKKIMKRKYFNETEMQKSHPTMDTDDNESADSDLSEDDDNSESRRKEKSSSMLSKITTFFAGQRRDQSPDGNRPNMSKLNVLVCGSDSSLKSSISELILQHTHRRSESVRTDVDLHGRLINVQELPALFNTGLSEDEVMRQALRCVALCDPGVHAFLFTVPVGPLTMDNKAEMEKIQKIFDCRDQFMVIFTSEMTVLKPVMDFVKATVHSYSFWGRRYRVLGLKETQNSKQIPELLDYIEKMKTEPYSFQMYVKAQEKRVRCETEEKYKEELKRMESEIKVLRGAECETSDPECLRIVLIGRTGSGKSATGNTILGREEFLSQLRPVSVTTVCKKGVGEVDGRSVAVVDTPGLFDTTLTKKLVVEEIVKCVSLSAPGPHVFVIVLCLGRFTKEEADTIDLIKKIFGLKSAQFSIVLFTRGDEFKDESIEDYVSKYNCAELQKLIRDCGNRFLAFNNNEKQDKTQVIELLKMIEEVKSNNQSGYFTNSMFEEAEMSIKRKMEEIMKEREREIQKQRDELQAKYETEMENMMKRIEEEKQRAEKERRKMENQLKEKEENLRKEFEEKEKTDQKQRETENQKRLEEEKQKKEAYDREIEEMKREIKNQRSQYKQQQKKREEEDRKREEKYRQDQDKMRSEQERIIAELKTRQEKETKKRDSEEKRRKEEEEKEKESWKIKIKEAENERKETKEEIKRQQREWEDEKKRRLREREKEEIKRKEKHEEQLREKQEELEKMRKKFEREREEERQKMEEERQKQRGEREEKEREHEEKRQETKRHYERLERERKEEWERRKHEDEERREEERKRWKKEIENLKREQEEEKGRRETEEKERQKREEKERDEMKQKHEEEIKQIKKKHEVEARKQAEESNDFRERKEQHIQELQQMLEDHQKQHQLLEKLYQHFKDEKSEEVKELKREIEDLKKKWCRLM